MKYGREILKGVEGYVPGEQPKMPKIIKLNTNENPYPPSPKVAEALREVAETGTRRYPDPLSLELRQACAERYGYEGSEWVVAGNGMDELLALAVRSFTDPGDDILTVYPTYTLYETLAALHGANLVCRDLDEQFQLTGEFFSTSARLCFLPRPNAPSGVCAPLETVEEFCAKFDGVIVIDEAYADFAQDNCMDFPKRFDNVIVMRTFSKSFSLAGMRLGLAVSQPEIISEILKTKDSYNLNMATQAAGLAAISDYDFMRANVEKVKNTRGRLISELRSMGFIVPDSQSNFVLARCEGKPSAREIFDALRERAIIVRYFDSRRLDDALRITVGTDGEIDALLAALHEIMG